MGERRRVLAACVSGFVILAGVGVARGAVPPIDPLTPGVDEFPSVGHINMTVNLPGQEPQTEDVVVTSQGLPDAQVARGPLQNGAFETEIVAMQLRGQSQSLGQIFVTVGQAYGLPPTRGAVENVTLNEDGFFGEGDSFFDVFFEVQAIDSPLGLVQARNTQPLNMSTKIYDLPPNRPKPLEADALAIPHYKCYKVKESKINKKRLSKRQRKKLGQGRSSRRVDLADQFEDRREGVRRAVLLCNPVEKRHGNVTAEINDSETHLVCYRLDEPRKGFESEAVGAKNQFGARTLDTKRRDVLCVPSRKDVQRGKTRKVPSASPEDTLSHFKCYRAKARGSVPSIRVGLADQFESRRDRIRAPRRLCNPVEKDDTPIENELAHLTCYPFADRKLPARRVRVRNQFGLNYLIVKKRDSLCAPTDKSRCSEYAEAAKVSLLGPGNANVGSVNSAIHVPYENDPEAGCP